MPQTPAVKSRAQKLGPLGPLQPTATTILEAANVQVLEVTTVLDAAMVQAAETTKVLEDLIARLDDQIAWLVKHSTQKNAATPLVKADTDETTRAEAVAAAVLIMRRVLDALGELYTQSDELRDSYIEPIEGFLPALAEALGSEHVRMLAQYWQKHEGDHPPAPDRALARLAMFQPQGTTPMTNVIPAMREDSVLLRNVVAYAEAFAREAGIGRPTGASVVIDLDALTMALRVDGRDIAQHADDPVALADVAVPVFERGLALCARPAQKIARSTVQRRLGRFVLFLPLGQEPPTLQGVVCERYRPIVQTTLFELTLDRPRPEAVY